MNRAPILVLCSAAALAACTTTLPDSTEGTAVALACDRGLTLTVTYAGDMATVRVNGGEPLRLTRMPTASGTHYAGGGYDLREHQGEIRWTGRTREAPYHCRPAPQPR